MKSVEFEHLFKTYYALLYRVAYDMLHDEEDSHDAVHEIYERVWTKGERLRPETEKAFLVRSVYNHCLNLLARKEREQQVKQQYPGELAIASADKVEEERLREIRLFVEKEMPPDTREVLRLCLEEEKSYAEAASTLNLSVAYVNKHMVRAYKMLRERFNPDKKK